jgi:uncharacterized protein YyaL (SSP411 family)
MSKFTNSLAKASSPYLLQHANNPVDWVEWSEEAFERAKREGKLVLVSIGYSACHWCHVMERESFEEKEVADLMNKHFVCIKVDREERPDVDQVYMNAVQLMTQKGGWPLNCFTLPDGRPIYGGTYFQKPQWTQVLQNLWDTYEQDPNKVEEYAAKLSEGVQLSEMIDVQPTKDQFDSSIINKLIQKWKKSFDFDSGGENRAPKFPLPNNYEFLLHYGEIENDKTVENHVLRTLDKMARGGIYDQVGGGFSRYAVDMTWKVPHFEKMLYDNGQLLSLYAKAYQHKQKKEYKKVLKQTVDWLEREMKDLEKGGYYSALDADSEGVEGKFYTWTKEELTDVLGNDFDFAKQYYNINEAGYWESGVYILLRNESAEEYAKSNNISLSEVEESIERIENRLMEIRSDRVRPGLDDKKITSWNALLLKGFAETGFALQDQIILNLSLEVANWIKKEMWDPVSQKLFRISSTQNRINGFLDDYANTIDALVTLYEKTFDAKWLNLAYELMIASIDLFTDDSTHFFYYTEKNTELIARKMEVNDNVIPSSNSVMAKNLYKLGILYDNSDFTNRSRQMLSNIFDQMPQYGSGYSNWAQLALYFCSSFKEVAVVGQDALVQLNKFSGEYLPHVVFAGGAQENIPFLKGRKTGQTTFYICEDQQCQAPVKNFEEALNAIYEK